MFFPVLYTLGRVLEVLNETFWVLFLNNRSSSTDVNFSLTAYLNLD